MRRVTRPGGRLALCFWDLERMPLINTFWRAVAAVEPGERGEAERLGRRQGQLVALLERAGAGEVRETSLAASATYADFEDYWSSFTGGAGPVGAYQQSLTPDRRAARPGPLPRAAGPAGGLVHPGGARLVRGRHRLSCERSRVAAATGRAPGRSFPGTGQWPGAHLPRRSRGAADAQAGRGGPHHHAAQPRPRQDPGGGQGCPPDVVEVRRPAGAVLPRRPAVRGGPHPGRGHPGGVPGRVRRPAGPRLPRLHRGPGDAGDRRPAGRPRRASPPSSSTSCWSVRCGC